MCEYCEKWRYIEGTNNLYQVSNYGRIRSLDKRTIRKDGKPLFTKSKILKLAKDTKGYLRTQVHNKTIKVHREVAKAFIPNPLNLKEVNHIDGNKSNNNVNNLEWCTHRQNINHAKQNNLYKKRPKMIRDKKGRFVKKLGDDKR